MTRRWHVSSVHIVGNESLQFLRSGIGKDPAGNGADVG
jgi:hypothetical protein